MKKRLILISAFLFILMSLLTGCTGKKDHGSETEETTSPQEITEETTTEIETTTVEETTTEEEVVPEVVEDYTVEVKEDEVFEIH